MSLIDLASEDFLYGGAVFYYPSRRGEELITETLFFDLGAEVFALLSMKI